jgi:SAM-dependent methyltransferase
MMLGLRERFEYFQCSGCGCLQIREYPPNLSKYYPASYYSFARPDAVPTLRDLVIERVDGCILRSKGVVGSVCRRLRPNSNFVNLYQANVSKSSRILDVGCGAGLLLRALHRLGFEHLTGADPFIEQGREVAVGLRLVKADLGGLEGRFDFVMLNHSLEHMPGQEDQFKNISRLIEPEGLCMIRVPVCSSRAWETYGTDWVQLDAPRHFYLHTQQSMSILASRAGLDIVGVAWDSNGSQFYGSEYYKRDLTFPEAARLGAPLFSRTDHRAFERQATSLNKAGLGDQAVFFLRRLQSAGRPGHVLVDQRLRRVASRAPKLAAAHATAADAE